MSWKQFKQYRKIGVLKNGSPLYSGLIDLIAVDDTVKNALITDLTNGSGLNASVGSYVKSPYPESDTWALFQAVAADAGFFGANSFFINNLSEVGDTILFYGLDAGTGYGVRFRRISDQNGGKRLVVGFLNNGTLLEDTNNPKVFDGVVSGSLRGLLWGMLIDEENQKAMPYFLSLTYHQPVQNYDRAYYGFAPISEAQLTTYAPAVYKAFKNVMTVTPDPYVTGDGPSGPVTPAGNYDDTSDTINIPSVPALNLSVGKLLTAYVPTLTELNDLADWLWQDFLTGSGISKLFADVMDSIISLHMLPFTPGSSTAITPTVGNFAVTGVSMSPLTAQFKDIDCGSLTISEYWGNYLDYNPYTKITLFLPFVGEVQLDADEVMGNTISVKYRVDCLTGSFVAFVSTTDKVLGQYSGNCALSVPVSAADYSGLHQAILNTAATAASVVGSAVSGGAVAAAGTAKEKGLSLAANIDTMKVRVQHSGAIGASAGFMGVQKPYVIIHRPNQCVPQYYNQFGGYPAHFTAAVGDVYGYTEIEEIKLDGLPFLDSEIVMLDSILKGGVYL